MVIRVKVGRAYIIIDEGSVWCVLGGCVSGDEEVV